jgi:hypothetical protein
MSLSVPLLNLSRTLGYEYHQLGNTDQNEGHRDNRYNHCRITKVIEGLPTYAGLHVNSPSLLSDFVQTGICLQI